MSFTPEQKRAWRNKPDVQARQARYKREWDRTNRAEKAGQRAYRRRASAGALNGAGPSGPLATHQQTRTHGHDSAAGQADLFGDTNN